MKKSEMQARIDLLIEVINDMARGFKNSDIEDMLSCHEGAGLEICVWCRESGEDYIHPKEKMSNGYDDELGGCLCQACNQEAIDMERES